MEFRIQGIRNRVRLYLGIIHKLYKGVEHLPNISFMIAMNSLYYLAVGDAVVMVSGLQRSDIGGFELHVILFLRIDFLCHIYWV